MAAMHVDLQGDVDELDSLGDDRHGVVGHQRVAAAGGAGIREVVVGDGGEHLGGEGDPLVRGVSRLAAGHAPRLTGWRPRLGRLDDVGGRWLGRVGGILEGCGRLLVQLSDGGPESDERRARGVALSLQSLAIGTRRYGFGIDDRRI
jgi:hypothetical protein